MKRLIPFDFAHGERDRFDDNGSSQRAQAHPHCRLPLLPDSRRTAFHAIITGNEDQLVFVKETPLEIVQIPDTDMVHVRKPRVGAYQCELLVTVTNETCYDVARPYQLPDPGTPVIVVGINLDTIIEAEILAGMEAEARYRPTLMRYQQSRPWYQTAHADRRSLRHS